MKILRLGIIDNSSYLSGLFTGDGGIPAAWLRRCFLLLSSIPRRLLRGVLFYLGVLRSSKK